MSKQNSDIWPCWLVSDDAGASREVNTSIGETITNGHTNSVSFMVNCDEFAHAWELMGNHIFPDLRRSLHFNLSEGPPLSGRLVHLAPEGWFDKSSAKIALMYLTSGQKKRAEIRVEIRNEFEAQSQAFRKASGSPEYLIFDSHQHVHMWPFALDEIIASLSTKDFKGLEIRIPEEPIGVIFTQKRRTPIFSVIEGLFKNLVLLYLSKSARRKLAKRLHGMRVQTTNSFCGAAWSGFMEIEVIEQWERKKRKPSSRGNFDEVLLHTGGGRTLQTSWAFNRPLIKFYGSSNRVIENQLACSDEVSRILQRIRRNL